jgi:hypothetical protein
VIWKQGRLRSDDYLMMFAGCWFVLLCVGLNQTVAGEGTNFMSDEEVAALTPETTKLRVIGAKWVFVTEQALMATTWSMKGCMLIVYARLTYVTLPHKSKIPNQETTEWGLSKGSTSRHWQSIRMLDM